MAQNAKNTLSFSQGIQRLNTVMPVTRAGFYKVCYETDVLCHSSNVMAARVLSQDICKIYLFRGLK